MAADPDTLCATALGTYNLFRRQRESESTQPDRE